MPSSALGEASIISLSFCGQVGRASSYLFLVFGQDNWSWTVNWSKLSTGRLVDQSTVKLRVNWSSGLSTGEAEGQLVELVKVNWPH